ncbi:Pex12 amino terminal region-domain-containing protein [Cyathus striatus]|nr:Pex12 amino terminal region-domain-containing protein [Cyathus striatus]
MSSQILQQAWISAEPILQNISSSMDPSHTYSPRIIRVAKLDSLLLDQELAHLLQEPINKAFSLISTSFKASFEPELALLIQLTLYKLSIWNTGASYGSKLQDLRYKTRPSNANSRAPSGLPSRTLLAHVSLTLIIPYFHGRFRSHALSKAWPDAPSSDRRRKIWEYLNSLESLHAFLGLINFIAFLWNGRYRTLADRLLALRLVPSRRLTKRDVSYEFMNRQMVWHAFTEFLLFLIPLVNPQLIRRRLSRFAAYLSSSVFSHLSFRSFAHIGANMPAKPKPTVSQKRGRYWSLPEDQCAICFDSASFNLDMSQPNNMFTSLATPNASSSENDIPAHQIYTPYIASCGHIYCYSCVAERMLNMAEEDDGSSWECLRCSQPVMGASRYVAETNESEGSGSDYEFSSDMDMDVTDLSGSVGSYSESGLSE